MCGTSSRIDPHWQTKGGIVPCINTIIPVAAATITTTNTAKTAVAVTRTMSMTSTVAADTTIITMNT